MELFKYVCLGFIFFCWSCQQIDYDLTPLKYEELETSINTIDIHTEGANPNDNLIFSKYNTFVYEYVVERGGKKYLAKYSPTDTTTMFTEWEYVPFSKKDSEVHIEKFVFYTPQITNETVSPGQSLIKVLWYNSDSTLLFHSNEGIIENHKNFWMHPLRRYQMWPTFTAPWPYVSYPLEIGKKYHWWRKLAGNWDNGQYIKWDKIVHFDYAYEVTGETVLKVNDKFIKCFSISAEGNSELGKTQVVFYFNPTLGFVKMEYKLMDDSKINMYLTDFKMGFEYERPELEF